jgi:hypothetical protein
LFGVAGPRSRAGATALDTLEIREDEDAGADRTERESI